jgi:hypothetical protein
MKRAAFVAVIITIGCLAQSVTVVGAPARWAELSELTIACNGMTFDHFRDLFRSDRTSDEDSEIYQKCRAFPSGTIVEVVSNGTIGSGASGLIQIRAPDDYVPNGGGLGYVLMIFADSAKLAP